MVRQIALQQFCHDIASAALSQRSPCAETSTPVLCFSWCTCSLPNLFLTGLC
jgi:hypothetical protein